MPTQKELDLEVADRLEDLVTTLAQGYSVSRRNMGQTEWLNLVSTIRYAIGALRSNK